MAAREVDLAVARIEDLVLERSVHALFHYSRDTAHPQLAGIDPVKSMKYKSAG